MSAGLQYREGPDGWRDYIGDRAVRPGDRLTLFLDDGTQVCGRYEAEFHRPGMGADRQPVLHVQAQCADHPGEPNPCACEGTVAVISLHPQPGGAFCGPEHLPGFTDRGGTFRSTLASTVVRALADLVVRDYLVRRPPCFLEEPYELKWLLSYCDTQLHRGTIYRAAGFELHRTNDRGLQTWRLPLRPLTAAEDAEVRESSRVHGRSRAHRARRAQGDLFAGATP